MPNFVGNKTIIKFSTEKDAEQFVDNYISKDFFEFGEILPDGDWGTKKVGFIEECDVEETSVIAVYQTANTPAVEVLNAILEMENVISIFSEGLEPGNGFAYTYYNGDYKEINMDEALGTILDLAQQNQLAIEDAEGPEQYREAVEQDLAFELVRENFVD